MGMASIAAQQLITVSCGLQASRRPHHPQQCQALLASCSPGLGLVCRFATSNSVQPWFAGNAKELTGVVQVGVPAVRNHRSIVTMAAKPMIQFIRGIEERIVPDVKLTRSRDGTNGVATFVFEQPSVFDSSRELGDITGLYLLDEEGTLSTVDVSAKFVNGKPSKVEARYIMRNEREWDRFMRFMERYARENELGFVKN